MGALLLLILFGLLGIGLEFYFPLSIASAFIRRFLARFMAY